MTNPSYTETLYDSLRITKSATSQEIKAAYHQALLRSHPDKQKGPLKSDFDIATLKRAYLTLSDPVARAAYDASLAQTREAQTLGGPRPAQVISFDEFVEAADGEGVRWTHACRCGGSYIISESDLDNDTHLIACERCSEVVYVGYDIVEEEV